MPLKESFFGSSIGRKVVMAVTGMILFGFVIGHMIGNLQVFLGAEPINAYGMFLRKIGHGMGLWVARGVLLAAVLMHIWVSIRLTIANRAARPVRYHRLAHIESTYASRTMVWSGPMLALFVIYHILHFTTGTVHPAFVEGDVYHNVITGFQNRPAAIVYIIAMLALGLHLYHGVWSMLQTLGLNHPRWNRLRSSFATIAAVVVVAGNISIPLAVMSGYLT